jgi:hypothetical protein
MPLLTNLYGEKYVIQESADGSEVLSWIKRMELQYDQATDPMAIVSKVQSGWL